MDWAAIWSVIKGINMPVLSLIVMFGIVISVVWSWHRTKDGFDLSQVLVNSITGKIDVEKVGYMSVLAIWCWGFIALILDHLLTEYYVGIGVGAFVIGKGIKSWTDMQKVVQSNKDTAVPEGKP